MVRYHAWAHALLLTHVQALSEEEYRGDCGLAFRSVHGTLVHLCAAEHMWLERLRSGQPAGVEHLWADGVTGADLEQHVQGRREVADKLMETAQVSSIHMCSSSSTSRTD